MSTRVGGATARQVIPDEIQVLFGEPPILYNENRGHYMRLLETITLEVEPKGPIEWFWVKDITDLDWEIRRLRRIQVAIIDLGQKAALTRLFKISIDDGQRSPEAVSEQAVKHAHNFMTGNAEVKKKLRALLETRGFDDEAIRAEAFHLHIEPIETISRMIAAIEVRRDKILREFDDRRATVGRRLREIAADADNAPIQLPAPSTNGNEPPATIGKSS